MQTWHGKSPRGASRTEGTDAQVSRSPPKVPRSALRTEERDVQASYRSVKESLDVQKAAFGLKIQTATRKTARIRDVVRCLSADEERVGHGGTIHVPRSITRSAGLPMCIREAFAPMQQKLVADYVDTATAELVDICEKELHALTGLCHRLMKTHLRTVEQFIRSSPLVREGNEKGVFECYRRDWEVFVAAEEAKHRTDVATAGSGSECRGPVVQALGKTSSSPNRSAAAVAKSPVQSQDAGKGEKRRAADSGCGEGNGVRSNMASRKLAKLSPNTNTTAQGEVSLIRHGELESDPIADSPKTSD